MPDFDPMPAAAADRQRELAARVIRTWDGLPVHTVAGVDTAYRTGRARAAVVVLAFPELVPKCEATAELGRVPAYRAGFLSFREGPAVLEAFDRLPLRPDLVLFDGHGIAHPRRCGLASHLGIVLDLPAVGCAKNLLAGQYRPPAPRKGSRSWIVDRGERIGAAVRTRSRTAPVFVSIGHRIDLETAIGFVLDCCRRFRIPEPLRQAHRLAAFPF